ncbi:hypothetical protein [Vibrio sp. 10N.261.55.A7]|uniref:hypothetical protein n=1 Tax=Vibrio sp. 10N.261.55.A7 TaxID=1880851 RepID=UPI000C838B5D|nr:hypothetical protein [Vibrio sp. 10N.261.55.A7]
MPQKSLTVYQANAFYNYSIGFDVAKVNLLKTADRLLKAGFSQSVYFSDFKCIYLDTNGEAQFEINTPKRTVTPGASWEIEFGEHVPEYIVADLANSYEIAFHESELLHGGLPYLRASLPPIVLDDGDCQLPLYASVKIYSDGITILSFQFDASWDGLEESDFLSEVVNIYKRGFKAIWLSSKIQESDAKVVLENAFENELSIAGEHVAGKKAKKIIKKMKKHSQKVLDESLSSGGQSFHLAGFEWFLHKIAGTENDESCESTVEICRSIYCNVLSGVVVADENEKQTPPHNFIWQGRPSVALLRFKNQPDTKDDLYKSFSDSISKILLRTDGISNVPNLPPDLRLFEDYCLHANRSIFLWTWLKPTNSPENVWEDLNTPTKIFQNQARTEHIEYHNLKIARACSWACNPLSNDYLLSAYETLASSESMLHQSSNSGEVSSALSYLIEQFGTSRLVGSAKESARYHLDEQRFRVDKAKTRSDRWLTFVFGLVGATSLAEFVIHPFVKEIWPSLKTLNSPLVSLGISTGLLLIIAILIWSINSRKT